MSAAAKPKYSLEVSRFKASIWREYGIDFIEAGSVVKAFENRAGEGKLIVHDFTKQ